MLLSNIDYTIYSCNYECLLRVVECMNRLTFHRNHAIRNHQIKYILTHATIIPPRLPPPSVVISIRLGRGRSSNLLLRIPLQRMLRITPQRVLILVRSRFGEFIAGCCVGGRFAAARGFLLLGSWLAFFVGGLAAWVWGGHFVFSLILVEGCCCWKVVGNWLRVSGRVSWMLSIGEWVMVPLQSI